MVLVESQGAPEVVGLARGVCGRGAADCVRDVAGRGCAHQLGYGGVDTSCDCYVHGAGCGDGRRGFKDGCRGVYGYGRRWGV